MAGISARNATARHTRPIGSNFYLDLHSNDVRWNLRADDLTQQSDECLTFLVVLLEPDDQ